MKPSEARTQLLDQHAQLRELMATAVALARELLDGGSSDAFRIGLMRLRDAISDHNATEEAMLDPLLRSADAWGPLRVKRMIEEHTAEHAAFRETLAGDEMQVAKMMADLAEELEAHMQAEERTILSPGVLRDDVISIEISS